MLLVALAALAPDSLTIEHKISIAGALTSHSNRHGKRLFDQALHIFAAAGARDGWILFVGGRAKKKVACTWQNCKKLRTITRIPESSAPFRSSLFTASSALE